MHRTRNAAYGQPYRGFESPPLRQLDFYSYDVSIVLSKAAVSAATREWRTKTAKAPFAGIAAHVVLGCSRIRRKAEERFNQIGA